MLRLTPTARQHSWAQVPGNRTACRAIGWRPEDEPRVRARCFLSAGNLLPCTRISGARLMLTHHQMWDICTMGSAAGGRYPRGRGWRSEQREMLQFLRLMRKEPLSVFSSSSGEQRTPRRCFHERRIWRRVEGAVSKEGPEQRTGGSGTLLPIPRRLLIL
ncbi:hypothetical protein FKM82_025962 [Ascaphus truei]